MGGGQSAVGWDYQEKVEKHESQTDYSKGFGGKFGVQTDRQDRAAVGFEADQGPVGTAYEKNKPVVAEKGKASQLRSRFESMAAEQQQQKSSAPHRPPPRSAPPTARPAPPTVLNETRAPPAVLTEVQAPPAVLTEVQAPPPFQALPETPAPVQMVSVPDVVPVDDDAADDWEDGDDAGVGDVGAWQEPRLETLPEQDWQEEEAQDLDQDPDCGGWSPAASGLQESRLVAVALYDYEAAADDEISFDPDDIITDIDMV